MWPLSAVTLEITEVLSSYYSCLEMVCGTEAWPLWNSGTLEFQTQAGGASKAKISRGGWSPHPVSSADPSFQVLWPPAKRPPPCPPPFLSPFGKRESAVLCLDFCPGILLTVCLHLVSLCVLSVIPVGHTAFIFFQGITLEWL